MSWRARVSTWSTGSTTGSASTTAPCGRGRTKRNVKRWRSDAMMMRWVSAALLEAKSGFRRVCGFRDLPQLIRALDAHHDDPHGDTMVA